MNNQIFYFFYNFAHHSFLLDQIVVFFAQTFQYFVFIFAGLFILFHHEIFKADNPFQVALQKYKEISFVFVSAISGWVLAEILKVVIHISRPFLVLPSIYPLFPENGYAFPSGHATVFMALAMAIFLSHKKTGYLFMFFALLIGVARVMSGVHTPVDILGGFVLGIISAFLIKYLYSKFAYFNRKM